MSHSQKPPTQGQRWFAHILVGAAAFAAVKKWVKGDVGVLAALASAALVGYAHEELDAPVARGIAALT
jgi:hypothetical protein